MLNNFHNEARERVLTYLTAAFGLVAGLAWNDAVRSFIEFIFPLDKNSVLVKFIYAVVLTFVLVAVTIYLSKFLKKGASK